MAKRKKAAKPAAKKAAKKASGKKKASGRAAKRQSAPKTKTKTKKNAKDRRQQDGPQTLRLRAFQPGLTVADLAVSMRFYTDVLGFIVGERWTDHGMLLGVGLKAGACSLALSQDDFAKGRDRQKGQGVRLWCETVQDIDAIAARVKAFGGTLTQEPTDQPWGVRSVELDDPDGYHLTIFKDAESTGA